MKTILDKTTRQELVGRISKLNDNSTAQWGKMNVYQMLKHVTIWDEWVAGKHTYPQVFIGRIFGRMALKKVIKDDAPLTHNIPTLPEFRISETTGDIAADKAKWIALIEAYDHFSNPNFVHAFFGKMTEEEIGIMAYKHADHHLRQFNC
jgi:hypothetical protein